MSDTKTATENPWHAVKPLVIENGDVGGDYQASESWSARFARDDKPGALITVSVYTEQGHDAEGLSTGEYFLTSQTEYLTCTDPADPGGTETWSSYEYETETPLYGIDFCSASETAAMAKLIAEDYAAKPDYFTWDGKPS